MNPSHTHHSYVAGILLLGLQTLRAHISLCFSPYVTLPWIKRCMNQTTHVFDKYDCSGVIVRHVMRLTSASKKTHGQATSLRSANGAKTSKRSFLKWQKTVTERTPSVENQLMKQTQSFVWCLCPLKKMLYPNSNLHCHWTEITRAMVLLVWHWIFYGSLYLSVYTWWWHLMRGMV